MSKRGTKVLPKKHLVTREIKRDDIGSKTILKKPDTMKFDVIRIPRNG